MVYDPSGIAAAIAAVTDDPHVEDAMLVGSYLESGLGASEVGDGSYGPFQLQLSNAGEYPGVTPAMAENPVFAARTMVGQYTTAVAAVPDALWTSDPEMASEEAAYGAERPSETYYQSQGQAKVDEAWAAAQSAEGYLGTPTGASTGTLTSSIGGVVGGIGGGAAGIAGGIAGDLIGGAASSWEKIGIELVFVAAGIGLVILGAVKTASPSTNVTRSVVDAGKKAATDTAEVAAA